MVFADRGLPRRFLSQKRWDRLKGDLRWLLDMVAAGKLLPRGKFWRVRGFLVYASDTYDVMCPFLRGIHNTAYAWMANRNEDGWKMKDGTGKESRTDSEEDYEEMEELEDEADYRLAEQEDHLAEPLTNVPDEGGPKDVPLLLKPVPRLENDIKILLKLLDGDTPAMRAIRPAGAMGFLYGFGDASGEGFGSAITEPVTGIARLRRGFWCQEISEKSSNYREFRNLLEAVKDATEAGMLEDKEVFIFTDNLVAEWVFAKGSSESQDLLEMVAELRLLELKGGFRLRIIHVAGTRMIQQGTDGLSRGELQLGSLLDPLSGLVPLNLDPIQRSPKLIEWISDWTGIKEPFVCRPEDWFWEGHKGGVKIWSLAPGAAVHALEELGVARLKRHEEVCAIVVVPALMRPAWFRRFARLVDVYIQLPAGVEAAWGGDMHESLIIGLCLPLLRYRPWQWKRCREMVDAGREVSRVYAKGDVEGRDLLRQLWSACDRIGKLPERLVCKMLSGGSWRRFLSLSRPR